MKPIAIALGAFAVLATQAFAQEVTDTDGDGSYSLAELQAVYTDLTEEAFAALDTDGNGVLSADELATAQADGKLMMPQ